MNDVNENPILFSAPMVLSILSGQKTETRRVLKVQPPNDRCEMWWLIGSTGSNKNVGKWSWREDRERKSDYFSLPYGSKGERLWVREAFRYVFNGKYWGIEYRSDGTKIFSYGLHVNIESKFREYIDKHCSAKSFERWMPPMFMHRWASRIVLENMGKHVECLGDITEESAISEGVERLASVGPFLANGFKDYSGNTHGFLSARESFQSLWESINGIGSWNKNLRVLVVKFKVLEVKG